MLFIISKLIKKYYHLNLQKALHLTSFLQFPSR